MHQRAAGQELQPFEEHAYEFGGCEYKLVVLPAAGGAAGGAATGAPAGPCPRVRLLVRLAELGGTYRDQVLGREVVAGVAAAFQGVAALMPPEQVEAPYSLGLDVDVGLLARLSAPQQEQWGRALASTRLLLAGHPLRRVFRALEAGTLQPGPPLVCCNTPGQVYVIKPGADQQSVSLVFPLRFSSRQERALGVACLQEFVEARRSPSLGRAPGVAYYLRDLPGELAGVDLAAILGAVQPDGKEAAAAALPAGASGGCLVVTLGRRHVAGPQQEGVVWAMATLHHFVAYHIKATKAMMHSRMRRRVEAMVGLLGQPGAGAAGAGSGAAGAV